MAADSSRTSGRRGGVLLSPAVGVPVVLVVALGLLLVAGLLLHDRAAAVGRAGVGDTGPVLAGVELPADGGPGTSAVALSADAATQPRASVIRELVQRQVDALNARDYGLWSATMTGAAVAATDSATFAARTRSQRLGSVIVRRVDPVGADEWVVPVGYITTQNPDDAPSDVRVGRLCWQVSTVVTVERGELRLEDVRPGSALRTPC